MTAASEITTILCFLNIQNFLLQFRMFNIEHNYSIVFQIQDLYWSPIWWIKFCFNYFLLLYKWFFSPSFSLVFLPSFIFFSFLFFLIISFYDGFFSKFQLGFFTIILTSFCFTDFRFSYKLRFLSLFWLMFIPYCRNIFFYLFSLHCLSNYFHFLLITRTIIFTVGQDNFGNKIL